MNCPDQLKDLEMELTPEKLISITSYKSHDQLTKDDSVSIDTALTAIEMARKEEREKLADLKYMEGFVSALKMVHRAFICKEVNYEWIRENEILYQEELNKLTSNH